jgi:hypothetical protein
VKEGERYRSGTEREKAKENEKVVRRKRKSGKDEKGSSGRRTK